MHINRRGPTSKSWSSPTLTDQGAEVESGKEGAIRVLWWYPLSGQKEKGHSPHGWIVSGTHPLAIGLDNTMGMGRLKFRKVDLKQFLTTYTEPTVRYMLHPVPLFPAKSPLWDSSFSMTLDKYLPTLFQGARPTSCSMVWPNPCPRRWRSWVEGTLAIGEGEGAAGPGKSTKFVVGVGVQESGWLRRT